MAVATPLPASTPVAAPTPAPVEQRVVYVQAPPAAPRSIPTREYIPPEPPAHAPAPRATSPRGVDPALRARVARYFSEMDNIQPGQFSGDPHSMANDMLEGAMKGDTSQLDDLVTKAQNAEQRARGIVPPAPCQQYHQQAVELSGESVQMLITMRRAMHDNDSNALMGLTSRASALQSQAEELQKQEQSLKLRFGVN